VTGQAVRGRSAFDEGRWSDAYEALTAAAQDQQLEPADFERLAVASYFVGRDDDSTKAWERAHNAWLEVDETDHAARCVAWLGLGLLLRGEAARANGWFSRGRRLIAEAGSDCASRGYLLVPIAMEALERGDTDETDERYAEVVAIAERCGDADLLSLGLLGRGEAALRAGAARQGLAFLDEAMVGVTTGELSPLMSGLLYCAVIDACMHLFDLRRAAEWTEAFTRWCDESDTVAYRGQCLVHRSQILQAHGQWGDAMTQAVQAENWFKSEDPSAGLVAYQQGELYRLRGDFDAAERSFRRAGEFGRQPAPGFALLRLAEGAIDAAVTMIRRMLDEARDLGTRVSVLPAFVDVMLADGDVVSAGVAGDELAELANVLDSPYVGAMAAHATGSVLLAAGDASGALVALRQASRLWRELGVPYEQARAQVLLGEACRGVGDHDAGAIELDAARSTFERLGAVTDIARMDAREDAGPARTTPPAPSGLTERECDVLRLVAAGKTNREIGSALHISEHTVARHVQNIFAKIDVSSRAAATAHAYKHGLV
jgi:ATP/maltotriose-dependent transcriptional regulator MalT